MNQPAYNVIKFSENSLLTTFENIHLIAQEYFVVKLENGYGIIPQLKANGVVNFGNILNNYSK